MLRKGKKVYITISVLVINILLISIVIIVLSASDTSNNMNSNSVGGRVFDEKDEPVSLATVRIKATKQKAMTDPRGRFYLSGIEDEGPFTVTAWKDGYFVGWTEASPGDAGLTINLKPYYETDNPEYSWFSAEGKEGSKSCGECMPSYDEWVRDAHSSSATNHRFLTMYNGTDVEGNKSPQTEYISRRDYGSFPVPPDPRKPYYGPGYKLDFPDTKGNCSACHVPAAAAKPGKAYDADPNEISGIEKEGVFCEFCHKIGDVILDPETGLPYDKNPGVLSMSLHRPKEGQQLFFGTFDDVTRRVSRLPLQQESDFCAPCHYGVFWDTVIYNSYGEWLDSDYSDPATGDTCQDCHMPEVNYNYFVYPEKGGHRREYDEINSHYMPGAADKELLQNSVSMNTKAAVEKKRLSVEVEIVNDKTGHHVPTGSPLRHMILLVLPRDECGRFLEMEDGPLVPDWCSSEGQETRNYGGLPGKVFAKVLEEDWTQIYPSGSYWNPCSIRSDNRIPAFGRDRSTYLFKLSPNSEGPLEIEVKLLYRRAFIELQKQKGWDDPDLLMERELIQLELR